MRIILLIFFIAILVISTVSSQQQVTSPVIQPTLMGSSLMNNNTRYDSKFGKGYISYEEILLEYETLDGSPFLYGKELEVDMIRSDGSIHENVTILYDLFNNEIIVKKEDGENLILDQVHYKGFTYNNKGEVETFKRVYDGKTKFCKVLFQNEDFTFSLTKKIRISDDAMHIPGQEKRKKKFVGSKVYFMSTKKTTDEVTLKNELLVNYLPNKYKSQIYRLKKKLKIRKLKKEKDYIRVMEAFEDKKKMK